MHRLDRHRQLQKLDPAGDREQIARALLQYEFPWDMMRSLELALFRTYAVPSIGRLLYRTGEFTTNVERRYDDTVQLLFTMWVNGPSGATGHRAAEHLNHLHGHYRISGEDFRYTLATFVVVPMRWLRDYGWRSPSRVEIDGWTNTMRDMGTLLHIDAIPATFEEFEVVLDEYEQAQFGYDPGSRRVAESTLALMASWYPRPLRPLVRRLVTGLLDEPLLRALGLPVPGRATVVLARAGMRARARVEALLPPRRTAFVPAAATYPHGYRLDELGPAELRRDRTTGGAA